jgi:hypothetical protein
MRTWAAAVADVLCVLVFVAIGRASHQEGDALLGIAATAWPFLAGLVVGWVVVRAWRAPYAVVPTGVAAWVAAVTVGMLLRAVSGQGTAAAFIIVATVFLGVVLLGWRGLTALAHRMRASRGTS